MAIPIPTSHQDLVAHVKIAEVSSEEPGKDVWTVLSLWWRADDDRPFVSVIEGRVRDPKPQGMVPRFRACAYGSLSKAMDFFDVSTLRDELLDKIPLDVAEHYPDGNTLRQRAAARRRLDRGYTGPNHLSTVLAWLYDDVPNRTTTGYAELLARDFRVPSSTVTHAITRGSSGWAIGFISAMRFFDKRAWRALRDQPREDVPPAHSLCIAGRCVTGHVDFCPAQGGGV